MKGKAFSPPLSACPRFSVAWWVASLCPPAHLLLRLPAARHFSSISTWLTHNCSLFGFWASQPPTLALFFHQITQNSGRSPSPVVILLATPAFYRKPTLLPAVHLPWTPAFFLLMVSLAPAAKSKIFVAFHQLIVGCDFMDVRLCPCEQ